MEKFLCREELKTLSEVQPGKTTSFRQLLSGAFGFSISDDMYQTLTNAIADSYLKGRSVDREIPRPVDDGPSDESELSADEADESDSNVSEDIDAAEISADDSEASEVSSSDEDEEEPSPKKKPRATKPAASAQGSDSDSGEESDKDSGDESDKDSTEEDVLGEDSAKGSDNDSHYSGSDNEEMEADKLVPEVDKGQDDICKAANEDVNEAVQVQADVPETIAAE